MSVSRPASTLLPRDEESPRPKGVFLSDHPAKFEAVWSPTQRKRLGQSVDLPDGVLQSGDLETYREWLRQTEIIFSTWGMPRLTDRQLALMPNLRAVFYAAGSVKAFAEPLLERGIVVVSAAAANAVPVAEFTLSQILFSLKLGWQHVRAVKTHPRTANWKPLPMPGVYHATVGILSVGMIGSLVCQLLDQFSVKKLVYDPYRSTARFAELRASGATLEEVFEKSDVVSLHTPWLPETEGMITGDLIRSMKPGATLINTARGALIREDELVEALAERPDLTAVLDVTHPIPPGPDSPLYNLPNVILTPHIAGSLGNELFRMSDLMIEKFHAWRSGHPLAHAVTLDCRLAISA